MNIFYIYITTITFSMIKIRRKKIFLLTDISVVIIIGKWLYISNENFICNGINGSIISYG